MTERFDEVFRVAKEITALIAPLGHVERQAALGLADILNEYDCAIRLLAGSGADPQVLQPSSSALPPVQSESQSKSA